MTEQKRIPRITVNGILLLDKPLALSSNQALQKIKYLFRAKKAGHTGSLDPLATGLLPICFGEATKFSQYLLDADKSYLVEMKLGVRTTTSDAEGEIVSEKPVPELTMEKIDRAFEKFRGNITQVPSMYSALKHNGQPLYALARQGITVERKSRPLTIYKLVVNKIEGALVTFTVKCSKGTYVRTLVDDFGEQLGCGAHVTQLRRLSVGPYRQDQMMTTEILEAQAKKTGVESLQSHLLSSDTSVHHWPEVIVPSRTAFHLRQGQSVRLPDAPASGWVRFSHSNGQFMGVGEVLPDGKIAPRRMVRC